MPISGLSQNEVSSVFKESVGLFLQDTLKDSVFHLLKLLLAGASLFGYDGIAGSEIFDVCRVHGFDNRIRFGDWASILPKISNFIGCLQILSGYCLRRFV